MLHHLTLLDLSFKKFLISSQEHRALIKKYGIHQNIFSKVQTARIFHYTVFGPFN